MRHENATANTITRGRFSTSRKSLTMKINKESANFIKWTITTLGDEDYFQYVIRRINDKQKDFYSGDRKELLKTLENKMEKGAIEHGNPIHNFKLIEKEFKDEMLDLIGWMMLYAWALNKEYGK